MGSTRLSFSGALSPACMSGTMTLRLTFSARAYISKTLSGGKLSSRRLSSKGFDCSRQAPLPEGTLLDMHRGSGSGGNVSAFCRPGTALCICIDMAPPVTVLVVHEERQSF